MAGQHSHPARPDSGALPRHVAIIMDGNGRWARNIGKDRSYGHQQGLEATRKTVEHCARLGIPYLSLYVFSTENWKRARDETGFLMDLLCRNLRKEYDFYKELGIRLVHSGDRQGLPPQVRREIEGAMADTAHFDGMVLNLAINYGGQDELVRACNALLRQRAGDDRPVTPADLAACLDAPELPEVDLVIRTGGDMRLSNFLLWKCAYAELYFADTLWPDWTGADLDRAFQEFQRRQRRFGGTP